MHDGTPGRLTNAEMIRRHTARQRAAGRVRVHLWVPNTPECRALIRLQAKRLCERQVREGQMVSAVARAKGVKGAAAAKAKRDGKAPGPDSESGPG